jgi:hypothetical protein
VSTNEWGLWYVAVEHKTVGPVSTELVIKGIEHRKIPFEAVICAVGGTTWMSLASVDAFRDAVMRSYPPPPPDTEEARIWLSRGFDFPKPAPLPCIDLVSSRPGLRPARCEAPEPEPEPEVQVDFEAPPGIDWSVEFHGFFLRGERVELPDEDELIDSLETVSRAVFRGDPAFWNLALCLCFGSDALAEAAARAFFEIVLAHGALDRLDWMKRTLLGQGFVSSGIPSSTGRSAVARLQRIYPEALRNTPRA